MVALTVASLLRFLVIGLADLDDLAVRQRVLHGLSTIKGFAGHDAVDFFIITWVSQLPGKENKHSAEYLSGCFGRLVQRCWHQEQRFR